MDTDSFWALIKECRRQARGREGRLAWLRGALAERSPGEVVQFQLRLDEVTDAAFTWGLRAAAERILGGRCSDDDFCYFRLWLVGLGREAFGRVVAEPDALAGIPEVRRLAGRSRGAWKDDWPEWESLGYVAREVYGALTGDEDDCGDAFYEAIVAARGGGEGSSDPFGE